MTARTTTPLDLCPQTAPDSPEPDEAEGELMDVHTDTDAEDPFAEFQQAASAWEQQCPYQPGDEGKWGKCGDGKPKDKNSLKREADNARAQYEKETDDSH